jgi:hypothetical protein
MIFYDFMFVSYFSISLRSLNLHSQEKIILDSAVQCRRHQKAAKEAVEYSS